MSDDSTRFQHGLDKLSDALRCYQQAHCGATPRDLIHQVDKVRLYRYRPLPDREPSGRPPLLVVYALINRPWILDLQEDRSMIRRLQEEGEDVYLVDWGYPDADDHALSMEDYVCRYIDSCVDVVRTCSERDSLNLLGVCQGGTLAVCYAALNPQKVNALVCMVTPVDFKTPDSLLSNWVQHIDVDAVVQVMGNIPGSYIHTVFQGLKPLTNSVRKYIDLVYQSADGDSQYLLDNFILMERWLSDTPDQPATFFCQFIRWLYQQNRLIKGELELGDTLVSLQNLRMPVLNITANHDHIVPESSSVALAPLMPHSEYMHHRVRAGHIGIFVGRHSLRKTPEVIALWLDARIDRARSFPV